MMKLWEPLLAAPVLPATVLLALLICWSLLAVVGGAVFHGHHLHLDAGDVDGDVTDMFTFLGSATFKWLGLGDMPLMIWLAVFSLLWWSISIVLWTAIDLRWFTGPGWFVSSGLIVRNLIISVLLTRLLTRPMRGWYVSEDFNSKSLIGQECEICSSEATPEYGQVRFKTDGAPLLLNVRTDGPHLAKGARVWITYYDAVHRAYIVSPTSQGE
jgi:Protein of unknown function (DUF1449)